MKRGLLIWVALGAGAALLLAGCGRPHRPYGDYHPGGGYGGMHHADHHGTRTIDAAEFRERAKARIRWIDADENGEIDKAEWGDSRMARHDPERAAQRFAAVDTNGDGKLVETEIVAAADRRFAEVDADADGKLTMEEMGNARADRRFARIDANGDGKLSKDEIRHARADRRFARIDADGDGAISQQEFRAKQSDKRR